MVHKFHKRRNERNSRVFLEKAKKGVKNEVTGPENAKTEIAPDYFDPFGHFVFCEIFCGSNFYNSFFSIV